MSGNFTVHGACTLCVVEVCLDIALINVVVVECIYQWRRQRGGRRGSFPPYGWMSKNYVICVCFHCRGTSSYHTTNTKPYKFPMRCSKCVSFWGTSYSRPPTHTSLPPVTESWRRRLSSAVQWEHRQLSAIIAAHRRA